MADMFPVHAWLVDTLEAAFLPAGIEFFDGQLPDGEQVPMLPGPDGRVAPHACFYMDEPELHPRGMGIDGPVDALGVLTFEIIAVGATPRHCTKVRDVVNRALVGQEVPDGGVIFPDGGLANAPVVGTTKPQRSVRTLGYWVSTGASGASA